MASLDFHTVLAKWLKKAKLRDGNRQVGFSVDGTFYYRGFVLAVTDNKDKVELKQLARLHPLHSTSETLSIANPNFFNKLRKALRLAMTRVNAIAIDPQLALRRNTILGGSKTTPIKK